MTRGSEGEERGEDMWDRERVRFFFFLRTSGGGKGWLVSLGSVVSAEFLEGLG